LDENTINEINIIFDKEDGITADKTPVEQLLR